MKGGEPGHRERGRDCKLGRVFVLDLVVFGCFRGSKGTLIQNFLKIFKKFFEKFFEKIFFLCQIVLFHT